MNESLHLRAQQLMLESAVEGLPPGEEAWLREHLAGCPECASEAATARNLLHALRAVPVSVPRDLAARTQLRVRLRAQETPAAGSAFWLWLVTAASWILGISSAPLVWKGLSSVGGYLHLPKVALEMGFVLWWGVPALFAVAIVLHQRALNAGSARGQN